MVNLKHFIGIDISKETVDVALVSADQPQKALFNIVFTNTKRGCSDLKKHLKKYGLETNDVLVCMEYTGLYSRFFAKHLLALNFAVWIEMPYQIKHSTGLKREKTDKADALAIAQYCARFKDKARLYQKDQEDFEKLQTLLTCRDLLVQKKTDLTKFYSELLSTGFNEEAKLIEVSVLEAKEGLERAIKKADKSIDDFVEQSEKIRHQLDLLTSIPSVGKITALTFIAVTRGFTKMNSGKALASYSGVAPFKNSSGTSVRGKTKVSFMANRKLKTLLHLCALRLIQLEGHFQEYYQRKVNEGKNKMLVINALRNKIVLRMYAVIKNNKKYSTDLVLS
jgi:transposase